MINRIDELFKKEGIAFDPPKESITFGPPKKSYEIASMSKEGKLLYFDIEAVKIKAQDIIFTDTKAYCNLILALLEEISKEAENFIAQGKLFEIPDLIKNFSKKERLIKMKRSEFLGRYVDRLVSQGNFHYVKDAKFLTQCADAAWKMWDDPKEGLQDETPENMADEEMGYWGE